MLWLPFKVIVITNRPAAINISVKKVVFSENKGIFKLSLE